ncbi:pilus assembly protein [Rhizobiales bacterium]|uniref:TadE/TadG family type IV pilus assembly protein n=1 Tax=Hongsoonwoonella zoysiae TaxID=2821844 RepID=UPI00155F8377|nr:TadE/TadG family type IV pilus assembly protein [Hongsoonwoonella zoysiae]NRG16140.1 pilus assembly protein [Hongsoonwoonella zoysiae]
MRILYSLPISAARALWTRLATDRRGVAAVEFALVLPLMLLLLVGMTELYSAMTLDRKLSQTSSTIADLVAQETAVTRAELLSIMDVAEAILDPYPEDGIRFVVAGVRMEDENKPEVAWSEGLNAASWATGAPPPIELPAELTKTKGSFLVVTHGTYTYQPVFTNLFKDIFGTSEIELEDAYYLRPRLSAEVGCCN